MGFAYAPAKAVLIEWICEADDYGYEPGDRNYEPCGLPVDYTGENFSVAYPEHPVARYVHKCPAGHGVELEEIYPKHAMRRKHEPQWDREYGWLKYKTIEVDA